MHIEAYAFEADVEATHWWFVGRRSLFASRVQMFGLAPDAPILDVGTSTGTNLRMLREIGMRNVAGMDFSPEAIRFCRSKGWGEVKQGDVCAIPFPDSSFDLVFISDVIEHVDDDRKALAEVMRVLRPGGKVIVTVPAFKVLWGRHDELSMHKRRYRMPELLEKVQQAGFTIIERFYFNYLLFLPILAARRLMKWIPTGVESENQINSPMLNTILSGVFALDIRTAPHLRPPFGASIFMTLEKPHG